jgi:hypothetical protein
MESLHFASSGREARRPWDGAPRSSSLRNSRSSACFKIWSCVHTGSGACARAQEEIVLRAQGAGRDRQMRKRAPAHLGFCAQVCGADSRHTCALTNLPLPAPTPTTLVRAQSVPSASGHANSQEHKSTGVLRRLREPRETGPGGLPPDDDTVEGPGGLQEDGCVPALVCSFPAFQLLAHHLPPPAQTNRRTRARATPDVNLDIAALDGRGVFEKDLHKLYFVYISSKPEDWKFILEVPTLPARGYLVLRRTPARGAGTICPGYPPWCSPRSRKLFPARPLPVRNPSWRPYADARAGQARRGFLSVGADTRAAF